ncbi:MAG TPA: hypothetical protein VET87_19090 [Rubrivivax sp.]|nr:hypothetical protein [Rubrivivax sp.]
MTIMNDTQAPASPQGATLQAAPTRPAEVEPPMSAAQRQRVYRQRSKQAVTQAIGEEAHASRVTLLALLSRDLALLEDDTAKSMHSAARNSARRVLNTLVTRYAISLTGEA